MFWKSKKSSANQISGIDRAQDVLEATGQMGQGTPLGFDWHHHDLETMQLVPSEIHRSVPHRGGGWERIQAGRLTPLYLGDPNPSVTFQSYLDPPTPHVLELWERAHSVTLPADYRRLLLGCNGGIPSAAGLVVPARAGVPPSTAIVRLFYGVGEGEYTTIDWALNLYGSRLPRMSAPIAEDHCGNVILLDVSGSGSGDVAFWDHEQEDGDSGPLFRLAPSFSEFMRQLRV